MLVALVSDTHGVHDPALASHFAGVDTMLHAGDVGSHGGHAAVLERLQALAPAAQLSAVRGNVDDDAAARAELPDSLLLSLNGWSVLLLHILADAGAQLQALQPDIVIHGHSHKYSVEERERPETPGAPPLLLINPGSAGPARFKLPRTAALLRLPQPGSGQRPTVERIELAAKAPPRLAAAASKPSGAAAKTTPARRQSRPAAGGSSRARGRVQLQGGSGGARAKRVKV